MIECWREHYRLECPPEVSMRENIRHVIQKAMVTNNRGNSIIWACQVVLIGPSLHLAWSQPLCGGRRAGDQAQDTWRVWNSSVLWTKGKVSWHCCSFCIQAVEWAMPRGSRPFFQQQQRERGWLLHSGMFTTIQSCEDGLSKNNVWEQVLWGKKPILMSRALLGEYKGVHSSFAWSC